MTDDYGREPVTSRPVWVWLAYQFRALPEGIRLGVMTVVLVVAQALISSNGLADVTDFGVWARSLGGAILLSLANLIWALVTPGAKVTRE